MTGSGGSDLLSRPGAAAMITDAAPEEGGRWELRLDMELETLGAVQMRAMADFVRLGQQFSGQTMVVYYMGEQGGPGFDADIEGELSDADVRLDINIQEGELKHAPFLCTGTAETEGRRYTGRWHMPCLDPVECGCEGEDGDFTLTRIGPTGD